MIYLFNTTLHPKKRVFTALTSIYGIGKIVSHHICDKIGITNSVQVNQLTNKQIEILTTIINHHFTIGGELRREERNNKNRLIKIASYRGFRAREGLPSRGQRTHTNGKTARKRKITFSF